MKSVSWHWNYIVSFCASLSWQQTNNNRRNINSPLFTVKHAMEEVFFYLSNLTTKSVWPKSCTRLCDIKRVKYGNAWVTIGTTTSLFLHGFRNDASLQIKRYDSANVNALKCYFIALSPTLTLSQYVQTDSTVTIQNKMFQLIISKNQTHHRILSNVKITFWSLPVSHESKTLNDYSSENVFPISQVKFFGHRPNVFKWWKQLRQFGNNIRKYRLVITVEATFNTTVGQMTEKSQRKKNPVTHFIITLTNFPWFLSTENHVPTQNKIHK